MLEANCHRHSTYRTHTVTQLQPHVRTDALSFHLCCREKVARLWLFPWHGFLEVELLDEREWTFFSCSHVQTALQKVLYSLTCLLVVKQVPHISGVTSDKLLTSVPQFLHQQSGDYCTYFTRRGGMQTVKWGMQIIISRSSWVICYY